MSDEEYKKRRRFFKEKDFKFILKESSDVYYENDTGKNMLYQLLLQKNYIFPVKFDVQYFALQELYNLRKKHDNNVFFTHALDLKQLPKYVILKRW